MKYYKIQEIVNDDVMQNLQSQVKLDLTFVSEPKQTILRRMRLASLQKREATISFSLRDAAPTIVDVCATVRK